MPKICYTAAMTYINTQPSSSQTRHSGTPELIQHICQLIKDQGPISFAQYMQAALYVPQWGYYHQPKPKFGAQGDYTTAPELSPLFGQCIANYCADILTSMEQSDILEFGAGSGKMAAAILMQLKERQCLPEHYYIIDLSPTLISQQRATLQELCPDLYHRVHWLSSLPTTPIRGVVLANEVLDAMPVERFHIDRNGCLLQYFVTWNEGFHWLTKPRAQNIKQALSHVRLPHGPYDSEVNLFMPGWLKSVSAVLEQGSILLIDYGYPQSLYYHPERSQGTLTCHHQHSHHDNPFVHIGQQDITCHVDFTALAQAAVNAQLQLHGFTTQAGFLIDCGLTDLLKTHSVDTSKYMQVAQALKTLTLPTEMGETCKVMALHKALKIKTCGFQSQDLRYQL